LAVEFNLGDAMNIISQIGLNQVEVSVLILDKKEAIGDGEQGDFMING